MERDQTRRVEVSQVQGNKGFSEGVRVMNRRELAKKAITGLCAAIIGRPESNTDNQITLGKNVILGTRPITMFNGVPLITEGNGWTRYKASKDKD